MTTGCTVAQPERTVDTGVTKAPMVQHEEAEYLNAEKAKHTMLSSNDIHLVGQLSDGIRKLAGDNWYVCGEKLSGLEAIEYSLMIANAIILNMRSTGLDVNPFGIAATMYNESGFDHCAIGLHPRKWGQAHGMFPKKKRTISMDSDKVIAFINNPLAKKAFRKTGFDLGLCQILSRFYPDEESEMVTVGNGIRICVIEMASRAKMYKTNMPWLYWRGKKTEWYRKKIRRWARSMGLKKSTVIDI